MPRKLNAQKLVDWQCHELTLDGLRPASRNRESRSVRPKWRTAPGALTGPTLCVSWCGKPCAPVPGARPTSLTPASIAPSQIDIVQGLHTSSATKIGAMPPRRLPSSRAVYSIQFYGTSARLTACTMTPQLRDPGYTSPRSPMTPKSRFSG